MRDPPPDDEDEQAERDRVDAALAEVEDPEMRASLAATVEAFQEEGVPPAVQLHFVTAHLDMGLSPEAPLRTRARDGPEARV
jgi:hypothetical protein